MAKIGEDMLGDMASLGLQELQQANAGMMAMDAPPIQQPDAPVEAPQPSYADMVTQQASIQPPSPDLGMER